MKILYVERKFQQPFDGTERVTMFTDSSMSRNRRPLFLPPFASEWVMRVGLGIRVSRLGKFIGGRFAHRYYDAVAAVARLVPVNAAGDRCSANLTAFDGSIVVGDWIPLDEAFSDGFVSVGIGPAGTVSVTADSMETDRAVEELSRYFTLKMGDIIVPGEIVTEIIPIENYRLSADISGHGSIDIKIK